MNSEGGLLSPAGILSSSRVCLLSELGLLDYWGTNYRHGRTADAMGLGSVTQDLTFAASDSAESNQQGPQIESPQLAK